MANHQKVPTELTPKGGKVPMKAVYLYPEGNGYLVYGNGHEQPFATIAEGISIFSQMLHHVEKRIAREHEPQAIKLNIHQEKGKYVVNMPRNGMKPHVFTDLDKALDLVRSLAEGSTSS